MSKIEVDKYMIFFFIYWHYFSISLVKNPKDQTGHKRGEEECLETSDQDGQD